jgi:hypothetical protein
MKSKRGLAERTKLLNDLFDTEKAKQVFEHLQEKAISGDWEAVKLFMAYCFGRPKESLDITSDSDKVSGFVVEVIRTNGKTATEN